MAIALTRKISPRFNECEITHIQRSAIDINKAREQHNKYIKALTSLGCRVIELPEEPALADSVFVEDTAFILPEVAVITRPGADSRKPETETVSQALSPYRTLIRVKEPATVDGGDVLILGKKIFVGLSTRTNAPAIGQIGGLLDQYGYSVKGIEMQACLHLKSAITRIDDSTLLINGAWVDPALFNEYDLIEIDASEPNAANCLPMNGKIIYPSTFPKTREKLERLGHIIYPVDIEEIAKAEGAVTCCSLIIE